MDNKIKKHSKNTLRLKKIIVGVMAGIICGLFGTGGGMILVPAFIYLLATSILSLIEGLLFLVNL